MHQADLIDWDFQDMKLTGCVLQIDKLAISQLGFLAQRRLARGVRLNHAEAAVWSFYHLSCSWKAEK